MTDLLQTTNEITDKLIAECNPGEAVTVLVNALACLIANMNWPEGKDPEIYIAGLSVQIHETYLFHKAEAMQ